MIELPFARVAARVGTPAFVYREDVLVRNVARIQRASRTVGLADRVDVFVPYFTNSNPHLFARLSALGVGTVLQSVEELAQLDAHRVQMPLVVSPSHLSAADARTFVSRNALIYAATLSDVRQLLALGVRSMHVRADVSPETNARHGLKPGQFGELTRLLDDSGAELVGLHVYAGTGSAFDVHARYHRRVFDLLGQFPSVTRVNLGGGFAFNYDRSFDQHFDWLAFFHLLAQRIDTSGLPDSVRFLVEPGRDVFADTGVMLTQVQSVEPAPGTPLVEVFTDASYVHLPSATIRERQHRLSFYNSAFNELRESDYDGLPAHLSGTTTLSSDRVLPGLVHVPRQLQAGDYVAVHDVGAYGATQHLEFLNKAPAAEVLIRPDGQLDVIAERGAWTDKTRNVPPTPRRIPIGR